MFTGETVERDEVAAWVIEEDWRRLHDKLRANAQQRIMLEAEEADRLLEAEDCRLYRRLGYVSMHEYMERELGYSRHAANERLRVAHELLELPTMREEFRAGELSFSHVRELTRIATPETEEAFVEAARGKTSRQVQQLVAGKKRGDTPETPPDPALITERVVLELTAETAAIWRRTRIALETERGERMTDDELGQALCRRATEPASEGAVAGAAEEGAAEEGAAEEGAAEEGAAEEGAARHGAARHGAARHGAARHGVARHGAAEGAAGSGKPTPAPTVHHAVTTCRACHRGWASNAGGGAPMTQAQIARALCDAVHVGDLESDQPTRAKPAIPPATRRKVFIRDHHACAVPGCRSTRNLDVHHIVPRSCGGTHEMSNLTVLCSGHHQRLHDGLLSLTGEAPHALVFRWLRDDDLDGVPRGTAPPAPSRARRSPARDGAVGGAT